MTYSQNLLMDKSSVSTHRPRVLFVSPVSNLKGGAERVLLELLSNPYLEPVLAVPEPDELSVAAERTNVPFTCYRPRALLGVHRPPRLTQIAAAVFDAFRCALRIRHIARINRCTIVHTNGLKAHALGAIVSVLFRLRVVVHLHDIPYSKVERIIWRAIGVFATRIILVSQPCWPGSATKKVVVLPNAVRPKWPALAKAQQHNPLRLGFVGRYHPNKGLDLLLDWVGAARVAGLDISVVLRGRTDIDHPAYWPRIRKRIEDEGLTSLVIDQGWRQGGGVYDDIDFLLVPSDIPDPAPLVVLEAMGAGVVVIGYPAGGIPQLIPSGTGSLVRTPTEFVAALRSYLETPGLYENVRATAYRHVKVAHDPEALARRFASICQSTLLPARRNILVASTLP